MRTIACVNQLSILGKTGLVSMCLMSLMGCASAQHMDHHSEGAATVVNEPLEQEWAKARLAKSPRHQEWVNVKHGDRTVSAFIVYPEVKTKATAVVVIHEINGLTDWVQSLTDQLAEAGYIAIAPDLLTMKGLPNATDSVPQDLATAAIRTLVPDDVQRYIDAQRRELEALRRNETVPAARSAASASSRDQSDIRDSEWLRCRAG